MGKGEANDLVKIQTCVLKVHIHCDGCKKKVRKILRKIQDVYAVDIDGELVKVTGAGNLDVDVLVKKLQKKGKHAEILAPKKQQQQEKKPFLLPPHFLPPIKDAKSPSTKNGVEDGGEKKKEPSSLPPMVLPQLPNLKGFDLSKLKDLKHPTLPKDTKNAKQTREEIQGDDGEFDEEEEFSDFEGESFEGDDIYGDEDEFYDHSELDEDPPEIVKEAEKNKKKGVAGKEEPKPKAEKKEVVIVEPSKDKQEKKKNSEKLDDNGGKVKGSGSSGKEGKEPAVVGKMAAPAMGNGNNGFNPQLAAMIQHQQQLQQQQQQQQQRMMAMNHAACATGRGFPVDGRAPAMAYGYGYNPRPPMAVNYLPPPPEYNSHYFSDENPNGCFIM